MVIQIVHKLIKLAHQINYHHTTWSPQRIYRTLLVRIGPIIVLDLLLILPPCLLEDELLATGFSGNTYFKKNLATGFSDNTYFKKNLATGFSDNTYFKKNLATGFSDNTYFGYWVFSNTHFKKNLATGFSDPFSLWSRYSRNTLIN